MLNNNFAPGFRLSVLDVAVLVVGIFAAIGLDFKVWWWGLVVAFVIGHFFLFCIVIRMARPLELAWAAVFVMLAATTIVTERPGWLATALISLGVTLAVAFVEMRKPSYHGLGWQWINPGLRAWWESQLAERSGGYPPISRALLEELEENKGPPMINRLDAGRTGYFARRG